MSLSKPYPIQKSDISFGADALYGLIRDLLGEGVAGSGDFAVSQRAAGANMSVDIAAGAAYVRHETPEGGTRRVMNPAVINTGTPGAPNIADGVTQTFAAADGTNPRVDRVVLQVRDSNLDAGGNYDAVIRVIGGTPSAGATLVNLTGAALVPANAILLANVLIGAGATTIPTANIDTTIGTVRQRASVGGGVAPGTAGAPLYDSGELTSGTVASLDTGVMTIPATVSALRVIGMFRSDQAGDQEVKMRFNGDSGSNYTFRWDGGGDSAAQAGGAGDGAPANGIVVAANGAIGSTLATNRVGACQIVVVNPLSTIMHKSAVGSGGTPRANPWDHSVYGRWISLTAINRISMHPAAGAFATGSRLIVVPA